MQAIGYPMAFDFGVSMRGRMLIVAGMVIGTAGCASRAARVTLPNILVPPSCMSEILLVGCDARVSPPKCKKVEVTYRRGCEEILVSRK